MERLEPWSPIENRVQASHLVSELRRELAEGHPLFGIPVEAVAISDAENDDILFRLLDGTNRVAVVHLTWTQNPPDQPPWPYTVLYQSFEEWAWSCMRQGHHDQRREPSS
jgi:hypothetical protein